MSVAQRRPPAVEIPLLAPRTRRSEIASRRASRMPPYNPLMPFLRYLMLLSLVAWIGGLIFFSFVVAPAAFGVLPTRHLAGLVVARSLSALHWIGIISGIVFLI